MWKSRLENLYFLGPLYFVLQFQEFIRSNFPFLGISMDCHSARSNDNLVITDMQFSRKYENTGGSSLTNDSTSNAKGMTSFMSGLSSGTLFGTVTVTWLFSSILLRTPEALITCLLRFAPCGTVWKTSLNKLYKFCFGFKLSTTLNTMHKSLFLSKIELSNGLKTRKVSLWKKMTAFNCLLATLVRSSLTTLRRWTKLSRLKNKFSLDSSSKPLGTLLILSTLFESGNSSLDPSNMTAISTYLNETTLTTSWTIDSLSQGFTLMISTSPTTAAAYATVRLSSSLRTSLPLLSTHDLQVSSTSIQSSPFVPSATFQSVLKSAVLETGITSVSLSSSPLSPSSFTAPSVSSNINYSSSFFSKLLSLPPTLATSLSQSSTTLPSLESASVSPTISPQVLSLLLVSPSLSPSPLPSSPLLSSLLSSSSSLSAPSPTSISSPPPSSLPSQSRLPSPLPSSPSLSLSPLSSSSSSTTTLPTLSPFLSLSTFPSALLSQSPKPLPSSLPPSTLSPLSSPSALPSAIAPLSPSTLPSPSRTTSPSSASLSLASSPSALSSAIVPLSPSTLPSPSRTTSPSSASLSLASSPSALSSAIVPLSPSTLPSPSRTTSPSSASLSLASSPSALSSAIVPLSPSTLPSPSRTTSPSSASLSLASSPSALSSAIVPLSPSTLPSPSRTTSPSSASLSLASSPSALSSAIVPLSPSTLPSPSRTTSPSSASLSLASSPSTPSSTIATLSPSTPPSPSRTTPPSSASLSLAPSLSLSSLITSFSPPSPSPPLSVSSQSKPPASISLSAPLTQLSLSSSAASSLLPTPTTSSMTSPSPYSLPLPPQSPSSPSALPSMSPLPSLSPSLSSPVLAFSNNVSLKGHTLTVLLHSMTSNLTSSAVTQTMASATLSLMSSASSSVPHVQTRTTPSNSTRIINVTMSLINEDFSRDLLNESSPQFVNLSRRVNSTLWELFSGNVEGLRDIIILRFRNGSVKVDFQLLISSKSNVTAQTVNQTLLKNSGTNNQGFIFGNILVQEKCSPGYCFNSGSCQDGPDGPVCSCLTGFVESRCSQKAVVVNGNYSEWSDFTECSTTCGAGRRRRSRACTNPPSGPGGKDCRDLGRDVEYIECNGDVRCSVSAEIWIAVGVACGVFLLILIFVVVLLLRRRRKQAEERNGLSNSKNSQTNGHSTIIPLEVIYEDKTVPQSTPKGQTNPEFIGDDDDDNDIYKAQLLLFLKQAHLIRPNIYPDEQDNQSDISEYSRSTSRKPSAVSRTSGTIEEDKEDPAHDVETSHESSNVTVAGHMPPSDEEKTLPTTVL